MLHGGIPGDVTIDVDVDVEAESGEKEDETSLKVKRINDIRRAGLEVIHVIHRHGIESPRTAYDVEAALIDAYAGLSNISAGHQSNDRGPMHATEIIAKYALPMVEFGDEKIIMININSADHNSRQDLYDRVRYAWRLSEVRARNAEYVLAVIQGVVHGVFLPRRWLPASPEHFPISRFAETSSSRMGFVGEIASPEIWEHYVGKHGKRLPEEHRNRSQNPVRYINC